MWRTAYRIAVLTASDSGASGNREDKSGAVIRERMEGCGCTVADYALLPDDTEQLSDKMLSWSKSGKIDLILTTGGTGLSPRDCTPEATLAIATHLAPGFAEAIRAHSMSITPRGMLSRGVSVVCENTLIINLPGSVKAVNESLDVLLPALEHGLDMLKGNDRECGQHV